ncbi:MAG: competence protein ComEA [Peptococcaceae bacterium]|jgi:competence protein ComEA|nr:competence protein ComEA [Peptococcaceae bacterium]
MLDSLSKKAQVLILLALGVMIFFAGVKYQENRLTSVMMEKSALQVEQKSVVQAPKTLTVHVVGAVAKPGVYTLEEGKRIHDLIQLASLLPEADTTLINLAAPLQDGKQVYVPFKGEATAGGTPQKTGAPGDGLININTAGIKELDSLPGIGPALAQRIIDYRENHGNFAAVEDITKVSGIGPSTLQKFKHLITVK